MKKHSSVYKFTFNDFFENTYLLVCEETHDCAIVDPGCKTVEEEQKLASFIRQQQLRPTHLLNTHCHLDHIFGNAFVVNTYQIPLYIHKAELPIQQSYQTIGAMYGMQLAPTPSPDFFLEAGEEFKIGGCQFDILFTPGHSPGSISFVQHQDKYVIGGDVLFQGSIGRTDLPGGDMSTLLRSIKEKLLTLSDDYTVYSGHGPETTIGVERNSNPFLSEL